MRSHTGITSLRIYAKNPSHHSEHLQVLYVGLRLWSLLDLVKVLKWQLFFRHLCCQRLFQLTTMTSRSFEARGLVTVKVIAAGSRKLLEITEKDADKKIIMLTFTSLVLVDVTRLNKISRRSLFLKRRHRIPFYLLSVFFTRINLDTIA